MTNYAPLIYIRENVIALPKLPSFVNTLHCDIAQVYRVVTNFLPYLQHLHVM